MLLPMRTKEEKTMDFEGVIVEMLKRNNAVIANSLHDVKCEIKELNSTLRFIGIQLNNLNEQVAGMEKNEK